MTDALADQHAHRIVISDAIMLTKSNSPTRSNALICFERRCTKYSSTPRLLYDLTSSSTICRAL